MVDAIVDPKRWDSYRANGVSPDVTARNKFGLKRIERVGHYIAKLSGLPFEYEKCLRTAQIDPA